MPGIKQDLAGKTFGFLTVIGDDGRNKHMNVNWLCQCECGKTTLATTTAIKSGKKISCGCRQYRSGKDTYNWTGYGEIPGSYLYQIRNGATVRGLLFEVTGEYLWALFLEQDRKCLLSGVSIEFGKNITASLDRSDNTKGYTKANVQWVHKHINLMKNHFPLDYFISMCKLVSAKHTA